MGSHMKKTTVEIPDTLLDEAKKVAARRKVPLRSLIEAGLRYVLKEQKSAGNFHLRDVKFKGKGLRAEFRDAEWDSVRQAAYENRGG